MDCTQSRIGLVPILIVRGASNAASFYEAAFGARETARYVDTTSGAVRHVDLVVEGSEFAVTEEARAWNSDAPASLGGSPVVLQLRLDDVDAVFASACRKGATAVFPVTDFCGERMGRLRDPFGHLWILSTVIEALSPSEKQRRRDVWASERAIRAERADK